MSVRTWHPALGLYVAIAVGALVLYLPNSANPEAGGLLTIVMIVITLPSGLVLAVLLALLGWLMNYVGLTGSFGVASQAFIWALFLVVGFMQWRYLAPWVIRKLQTHT